MAPPPAAPQRGKVARGCDPVCGVPCNLRVARDRAAQQNAAVDKAVLVAQKEAACWDHGMPIHASTVPEAARGAVAACQSREAEAAAREAAAARGAHAAQEAAAKKEAKVKALEQALAEERAQKEAEMKAQADAMKREAIETARQKVVEEEAKTKAKLRALDAGKARVQQQRERQGARAHEEAKRRAAEATATAMEDAARKVRRETPPGASRVDILRRFFDGDPPPR